MELAETRAAEVAQIADQRDWIADAFAKLPAPENAELKAKLWDSLMLNVPSWLRQMSNGDVVLREEMQVPSHTTPEFMLKLMTNNAAGCMLRSLALYTLLTGEQP